MSKYTDYRIGNVVLYRPAGEFGNGYFCKINAIDTEKSFYNLKSVANGEYYNGNLNEIKPLDFNYLDWELTEGPKYHYTNSECLLYEPNDVKGYIAEEMTAFMDGDVIHGFEATGVKLYHLKGFQVKKLGEDDWLIDGTEPGNFANVFIGLRYVHEYQNIYADEFTGIKLDLDRFLSKMLTSNQ